jgi:Tat protein secretion system quality control protein TatD with DNase activity
MKSAEVIAEVKEISREAVLETTAANARKFFNLPI